MRVYLLEAQEFVCFVVDGLFGRKGVVRVVLGEEAFYEDFTDVFAVLERVSSAVLRMSGAGGLAQFEELGIHNLK